MIHAVIQQFMCKTRKTTVFQPQPKFKEANQGKNKCKREVVLVLYDYFNKKKLIPKNFDFLCTI